MPRFKYCGDGSAHSHELARRSALTKLTIVRWALSLAMLFALTSCLVAQDDPVHIDPRPADAAKPPTPKQPEVADPNANAPGVSNDPGLRVNHGKPTMVDVNLVLVNVTVTDDWNRIVTGLDKQNFAVAEGSESQELKVFSNEDAPISLGVIFDMSGSMSDKIEKARAAVIEFLRPPTPRMSFS